MPEPSQPPRLLSWSFHVRFFPSVLRRIFLPREKAYESPFAHHGQMEWTIILTLSLLAAILGFASGLGKGSVIGWFFAVLGTGGFVIVVVHSISSRGGQKPSFDNFRSGVFFLLLFAGFTAGLGMGHAWHLGYWVRLLCGLAGAFIGYFLGILGGLGIQYLGWLSELLDLLAGLALAGMVIVDILMLL